MTPKQTAHAAVEAKRQMLNAVRRAVTTGSMFVVLLAYLTPISTGAYTTGQAATKLGIAFAVVAAAAFIAQETYMRVSKSSIERQLLAALAESSQIDSHSETSQP